MALSELRANTVVVQLRARGVPADRMTPEGRGASDAIDDDSSEAGRAANRRVALQVIEK
jgi:outer membrane protein OmpA-like peptidoglycan-associated protein